MSSEPTIWIGEEPDWHATGRWSARFTVWADERSLPEGAQGPEFVELEEALAWARCRSPVVVARIDNSIFYGGSRVLPDVPPLPDPLPEIRPRPMDTPWDGSQQERRWSVTATIVTSADRREVKGLVHSLAKDAQDVSAKRTGAGEVRLKAAVVAESMGAAIDAVTKLLVRHMERVGIDGYARYAGSS